MCLMSIIGVMPYTALEQTSFSGGGAMSKQSTQRPARGLALGRFCTGELIFWDAIILVVIYLVWLRWF